MFSISPKEQYTSDIFHIVIKVSTKQHIYISIF